VIKTILIVDDEPAARYGLRRALESKYRIAEADSAEAARDALVTEKPDLSCWTWCCPDRMDFPS
jgi:PleD family two-component response regulator